jgi:hypothetical protein
MNQSLGDLTNAVSDYAMHMGGGELLALMALIRAYPTLHAANEQLRRLTGIRSFFPDQQTWEKFRQVLGQPSYGTDIQDRQWGDFQTPRQLALQVCRYLAAIGIAPQIVIEPTYGIGNFIHAALTAFPQTKLVYGVEIQQKYEWHFKIALLVDALQGRRSSGEIELYQDNIFTHRFPVEVRTAQDLLIIGNPPWVTNTELSVLNSDNLPAKHNLKALNGLDAITGKSNFDLAEAVILRLLEIFAEQRGTLAMLCKNSVIKNLIEELPRHQLKTANIRAYAIDARRQFNAAVEASLLVMDLGRVSPTFSCQVATLDQPDQVTQVFGWVGAKFVADTENYSKASALDGESPLIWRQGLKHDCAKIMELDDREEGTVNGNGEVVDIESEWLFSLLKSSDLRSFEIQQARKKVIVTQHYIGEETAGLQIQAPRLWQYLNKNSRYFSERKSRIYMGKPPFSIFGIGKYSFKPFKVAIASLYKQPYFALVLPIENRAVMFDDTCYFLGFDTYLDALFTASLLNSAPVRQLLRSIVFTDAKRPYTKEVLMRIDLAQAIRELSFDTVCEFWSGLEYQPRVPITEADFADYAYRLQHRNQKGENLQLTLGI